MLKRIASFIALISLTVGMWADEIPDSVFEADPYFILMGEADSAIIKHDWPTAVLRLNDALAVKPQHPSNALLYNNLATVYGYMGQDSLSLDTFNKGLEIAPNMLTLILGRGRALLANGKVSEAFVDFNRAVELDSVSVDARYYRGMVALYGGDLVRAERDFEVMNRVAPKLADTAIALSTLYAMTHREKEAIPLLKGLIAHDPAAEFYATLAECYLATDDLSNASETIGAGLERYPQNAELYYCRAWLNRGRYLLDDAQADAKTAIKLGANPRKVNKLFKEK